MKKTFVALWESAISRYNHGGFLASDVVNFIDNVLSNEFFKTQPEQMKTAVKDLIDCGCNLRVKTVKSGMPAVGGAGNPDNFGYSFSVEVVPELAPGRFDYSKTVTVPTNLLKLAETDGINLPKIPAKFNSNNKVQIDPVEVDDSIGEGGMGILDPKRQTRTSSHDGKKNVKGDRTLANKNIKIPASPAKDNYTARYMEK